MLVALEGLGPLLNNGLLREGGNCESGEKHREGETVYKIRARIFSQSSESESQGGKDGVEN